MGKGKKPDGKTAEREPSDDPERRPDVVEIVKPALMRTETYLGLLDQADETLAARKALGLDKGLFDGGLFGQAASAGTYDSSEEAGVSRKLQHKLKWGPMKQALRRALDAGKIDDVVDLREAAYEYARDEDGEAPHPRTIRNHVNKWAKEWGLLRGDEDDR